MKKQSSIMHHDDISPIVYHMIDNKALKIKIKREGERQTMTEK